MIEDGMNEPGQSADAGASPREMATSALETVKADAASLAATTRERASDTVAEKTQAATRTLEQFAGAIRKAGGELAQQDQSLAGRLVKQAADGLETLSRSVSDKRPEELVAAARDFGRSNPAAFVAGTVLVGIALGRLVKSSEARTDDAGAMGARRPAEPATFTSRDDDDQVWGAEDEDLVSPSSAPSYGAGV